MEPPFLPETTLIGKTDKKFRSPRGCHDTKEVFSCKTKNNRQKPDFLHGRKRKSGKNIHYRLLDVSFVEPADRETSGKAASSAREEPLCPRRNTMPVKSYSIVRSRSEKNGGRFGKRAVCARFAVIARTGRGPRNSGEAKNIPKELLDASFIRRRQNSSACAGEGVLRAGKPGNPPIRTDSGVFGCQRAKNETFIFANEYSYHVEYVSH